MAGVDLTQVDTRNNLQIEYGRRLATQINNRMWLKFPKSDAPMTGSVHKDFVLIGEPESGGTVPWESPIQSSGQIRSTTTTLYDNIGFWPLSISWASIAKSSSHAFAKLLTMTMDSLRNAALRDMERMSCGDGSGRLGYVTAVSTTPLPTAGNWYVEMPWWCITRLRRGHRIHFYSGTLSTSLGLYDSGSTSYDLTESSTQRGFPSGSGYFTVAEIYHNTALSAGALPATTGGDATKGVIKITESAPGGHGIVANDVIVKYTSIKADAIGAGQHAGTEWQGLRGIISKTYPQLRAHTFDTYPASGTFQGIDPNANTWFQSMELDAGGLALDDTHFDSLEEQFFNFSSVSADEITEYIANPRQKKLLLRDRYGAVRVPVTGSPPDMPIGSSSTMSEKKTLKINEKPLRLHHFVEPAVVYARTNYIEKYECQPFGFEKPELAAKWHQNFDRLPNTDTEAWAICQHGTNRRNALAKITNLATS